MFWYYLRTIFAITVATFYKRFQARNLKELRVKNPVLISMNHPNAFMDPIAFSTILHYPRTYYLARGDAFKKGFISFMLEIIGLVPIFRMQDAGIEGVRKNNESFKTVYRMLGEGKKIMVFSEGLCIQERRLRPIQKGTARMAFGFIDETGNQDILIVPVGITYSKPEKFRSCLFYDVGKAIAVKDYYPLYKENQARGVNELTREIEKKMRELVPHLNDKENDRLIEEVQEIYKQQWLDQHGLEEGKLEDQQQYWQHIITRLNELNANSPDLMVGLRKQVHIYIQQLQHFGLRDHLIRHSQNPPQLILKLTGLIMGYPVYLIGKIIHFVPWYSAKKIADKAFKDIEFHSSVNMVSGSFIAQLWFIAELIILWFIFKSIPVLGAFTIITIACGWFALRFSPYKKKVIGAMRLQNLKKHNKAKYDLFIQQRAEIVEKLKE